MTSLETPPLEVPSALLAGLNAYQAQAVATLHGPLLIVAGPGSGKTRVLTHRIAALLETNTAAVDQILAVTFTNRAATEMRERVVALVGPSAWSMWVMTFHAACVRILRQHTDLLGLPRSFSIVDASEARGILARVLHDAEPNAPVDKDKVKEAQVRISLAKNADLSPEAVARYADAWVGPVMQSYNRRLREMGAMDFDDILLHCLHLLQNNPNVAAQWRARFRHVMVDEFQDTNAVQYRILELLSYDADSLCVVGDPDQSIYGFRGAAPEVMTAFQDDHPTASIVVLSENYRSTPAILRAVQSIIDANPSPRRAHLVTSNEEGEPVRLITAYSSRDEARFVVHEITQRLRRRPSSGPYAILVRTNFQTRSFEEELTREAIRYQVLGALRFYDRAEVKDALSYLRVALNHRDKISLTRCLNTPRRGIGKVTGTAILDADDPIAAIRDALVNPTTSPISLSKTAAASLKVFVDTLDDIAQHAQKSPGDALAHILSATGLRDFVGQSKLGGPERQENLDELVRSARDFAKAFDERSPATLAQLSDDTLSVTLAYLENVALVSANDDDTSATDVVLLSAHASKGKEFPHVYVTGVEEGLFPHLRALGASGIQEERRLLFVAASRARSSLTFTLCAQRWVFGETRAVTRSRFLADLPDDVERLEADEVLPSAFPNQRRFTHQPATPSFKSSRPTFTSPPRNAPTTPAPLRTKILGSASTPPPPLTPRLDPATLRVGQQVEHTKFGVGTIRQLRIDDRVAVIDFAGAKKDMNLDFAPLRRVSSHDDTDTVIAQRQGEQK